MAPFEKIDLAVEELRTRRVRKATAAPLLYRLLWRLGVAIPPPLFQSFLGAAVLHGLLIGVPIGAFLACWDRRLAPVGATYYGTIAGAIYGLLMATYLRWQARRLGLPRWADFPEVLGTEEEEGW
jgi:uncharacterized protein DUF6404